MVNLTIDGRAVSVPEGTSILDAAATVGINIPTLCYLKDLNEIGACRICVVEIEGIDQLVAACNNTVLEGMVVYTNSPKVRVARRMNMELLLATHDSECTSCVRSGNCTLQSLAADLGISELPYEKRLMHDPWNKNFPLIRNNDKCVNCLRCIQVCEKIQGLGIWDLANRATHTSVNVHGGMTIEESDCTLCGQCITHCPTGALRERDDTQKVFDALADPEKVVVVQIAPAVRAAWGESLGLAREEATVGRLVAALRQMGVDYVFDTNFSADLTIMEEGTELLRRLKGEGPLPMVTSCCPAWVKYCETYAPEYTRHLSTAKSPQQMFGALIKTCFAERAGLDPRHICSVSIMPCTAKKFECKRAEMKDSGYQDVDYALTVQELARMIQSGGICFSDLPETPFDDPFGLGSGAGLIFGATGGVMEAALRTVHAVVTGRPMERLEYEPVRGFEGVKEAQVDLDGTVVKVAVAHGMTNAKKLLDQIRAGKSPYHFIEIMACPGGCIGGGGNAPRTWKKVEARKEAIYRAEQELPVRQSHENPAITWIYENYLGEPNSPLAHKLLHTQYVNRQDLLR